MDSYKNFEIFQSAKYMLLSILEIKFKRKFSSISIREIKLLQNTCCYRKRIFVAK